MIKTILALHLVLGLALCAGCSRPSPKVEYIPRPTLAQVPVPTAYPLATQQKMQAMGHWEVLAEDIARKVHEVLEKRVVERQFPVYVAPSGSTPFAKSFHTLLITRLVGKNIIVSNTFEDALILSFDLDMIRHADRITRTGRGLYKALAPDVYLYLQPHGFIDLDAQSAWENELILQAAEMNVDAGVYTYFLPRVEVMITSTLLYGDTYLMRDSSIYYINDADWWQYRQYALPQAPGVVNYQLVDR
ncbi:MAG TPA: hypothetical protein ENN39_11820 [Desulfonatronum sp.]|nr:hypothetical protein [Desulfonatronum sp.]